MRWSSSFVRRAALAALLLPVLFTSGAARALSLRGGVEDATAASEIAVHARVLATAARWVEDARGRHIYTYATLEAAQVVKGRVAERFVAELPGGTVGGIKEEVVGVMQARTGDELYVLLDGKLSAASTLGVYPVRKGMIETPRGPLPLARLTERFAVRQRSAAAVDPAVIFADTFLGEFPGSAWTLAGDRCWQRSNYVVDGMVECSPGASLTDSWMVHGPFSLEGVDQAWFKVRSSYAMYGTGRLEFLVSGNGSDWSGTAISGIASPEQVWTSIDLVNVPGLGSVCGLPQVWIAVRMRTEVDGRYHDAQIERVEVTRRATAPDLAAFSAWASPNPVSEGQPLVLSCTVRNIGDGASAPTHAAFYYSRSGVLDADSLFAGNALVDGLAPGFQTVSVLETTLPDLGSGFYSMHALCVADPDDEVLESEEPNLPADAGFFVDDSPGITNIIPSSAPAGTGAMIRIVGHGFGSAPGSVSFPFDGSQRIEGTVLDWSDHVVYSTVPVGLVGGYAASAGSGSVFVSTPVETVETTFDVPFGYGGMRRSTHEAQYYVANTLADPVRAAASTWNAQGADFRFTQAAVFDAARAAQNGTNEVGWTDIGGNVLAGTWIWSSGEALLESDTMFNKLAPWSDNGSSGYDKQTVALHEFGHWLALRDLYGSDYAKTMYGINDGSVRRDVAEPDRAGLYWIYGAPGAHWSLYVQSDGAATPPAITVTPKDRSNLGGGTVPFSRDYSHGQRVTLTAPESVADGWFAGWWNEDENLVSTVATTEVYVDAGHAFTARYGPATTWYRDEDGDGYGDAASTKSWGPYRPPGYARIANDNCPAAPNPDQADFDGDGIGNACESGAVLADIDNSQHVDGPDLFTLERRFGAGYGDPRYDRQCDLDRNGIIDGNDLAALARFFGADAPKP